MNLVAIYPTSAWSRRIIHPLRLTTPGPPAASRVADASFSTRHPCLIDKVDPTQLTWILTAILIAASLLRMVIDSMLLKKLRTVEPAVYDEIGRPKWCSHMSVEHRYWYSFLLFGKYKHYSLSQESKELCRLNRVLVAIENTVFLELNCGSGYHRDLEGNRHH